MHVGWAIGLRVTSAFGLAMAGGIASVLAAVSHDRLCLLISLAAGTLLGVTLFSILPQAHSTLPVWSLAVTLTSGYLLFWVISRYVFHVCPACAASHFDATTTHRFGEIAGAMVIALAIHSTMDGLALAAGAEAGLNGQLDAALVVAIGAHKVPEGLALGALLLGAGHPRSAVLAWVAAVEATTLAGGAMGSWVLPRVPGIWLDALLAHVGGGFIFLAVHAVFGELRKHGLALVVGGFVTGLGIIAALELAVRLL